MAAITVLRPEAPGAQDTSAADALIAALADRHVPLTRGLAEELVRLARTRQKPGRRAPGLLGRIHARLDAALDAGADGRQMRIWTLSPWDCMMDWVVEPILRDSSRELEEARIYSPLGEKHQTATDDWDTRFEAEVEARLASTEKMGADFWVFAAVGVYGAAERTQRRLSRGRAGVGRLSEPDPLLVRVLLEVEPILPRSTRRASLESQVRQPARERAAIRPKEGGIAGIRRSTAIEDLPDVLISELAMPDVVLLSRLTGDGVAVRHRPPQRRPKRDLLVLCLVPEVLRGEAALIAKAAWIDGMIRLWPRLTATGSVRCDFVWAARLPGGVQTAAMQLDRLRAPSIEQDRLTKRQRRGLLFQSGLFPSLANQIPNRGGDPGSVGNMMLTAMATLTDRSAGASQDGMHTATPRIDGYAAVHLCAITEADQSLDGDAIVDWPGEQIRLAARTGMAGHPSARITRVQCPTGDLQEGVVRVDSGRQEEPRLISPARFPEADPKVRLASTIGALSQVFIDHTLQASHGR